MCYSLAPVQSVHLLFLEECKHIYSTLIYDWDGRVVKNKIKKSLIYCYLFVLNWKSMNKVLGSNSAF